MNVLGRDCMNLVNGITFRAIDAEEPEPGPDVFRADLARRLAGPGALFEELESLFKFPCFGFNWDALEECLSDLQWISPPQVVISHHVLPELSADDFRTYLEVLCGAAESWSRCEEQIKAGLKEAEGRRDSELEGYWRGLVVHGLEARFNRADEKLVRSLLGESAFAVNNRSIAGRPGGSRECG